MAEANADRMRVSTNHHEDHPAPMSRRRAVGLVGLASLAAALPGCASAGRAGSDLPEPVWPDSPGAQRVDSASAYASRPSAPAVDRSWGRVARPRMDSPAGVIGRARWARGTPVPILMDRMLPVRRITVHHDGMTAFTSTSESAAAERIEAIRRAHRGHNWGDIGYHYLIDPAGRVWEGRPLSWQGAHVKDQNEGNIGVCVMGNYERQEPNPAQLGAVERFVADLMRRHRVGVDRVYTHRELAATACPGRTLQPRLVSMRGPRGALAMV